MNPRLVTTGTGKVRYSCECGSSFVDIDEADACCLKPAQQPAQPRPLTGGSSDYYKVKVGNPSSGGDPYIAECNDIIEALGMTYAEGNVLKAVWRLAAGRQGQGKAGSTPIYEAEKVEYFGKRLVVQAGNA